MKNVIIPKGPQVPCPHCTGVTCKLISDRIGFSVGVEKKTCEMCLGGGVDSPASVELRGHLVDRVLKQIREDPETQHKVAGYAGWQKTQLSWRAGSAWLRSKASRVLGPVSLKILETRKQSCFGRVDSEACPMLKKHTDGFHYCGACGCGIREDTRLDGDPSKLEYPYLQCPLGRDGFSNEGVPDRILHEIPRDTHTTRIRKESAGPVPEQVRPADEPLQPPPAG